MTVRNVSLALVLLIAVCGAPLLHALVPHTHTHEAHGGESAVWQSLHQGLRHEDKYVVVLFDALTIVGAVASFLVIVRVTFSILDQHAHETALRRGILPHRKFG